MMDSLEAIESQRELALENDARGELRSLVFWAIPALIDKIRRTEAALADTVKAHNDVFNLWETASGEAAAAEEKVRELEALVQHMEHTTYCAYCGFEVTIDSPDSSIVVAEHIRTCDKHPLGERVRWLEKELLDLDSRSTGYRVRAERGEARVRELEITLMNARADRDATQARVRELEAEREA